MVCLSKDIIMNLLKKQINNDEYTVDNLNQTEYLVKEQDYEEFDFCFDLDGNMITNQLWAYTWNAENRMVSATNSQDGTYITYDYDFKGRNVRKVVNGDETIFIWNGNHIIAEMTDSTTNLYTWANGETLTANLDGETVFYCHDANKNVTDLVDDSGDSVAHYEYSPFGVITEQTGTLASGNLFRFSNEVFDETTGIVEFVFRPYFPPLGKFMSRDPIGVQGGLNETAICGNDLINHWDELGLYALQFKGRWSLEEINYFNSIYSSVKQRIPVIMQELDVLKAEAKELPNACEYKLEWLIRLAETRAVFQSTLFWMKSSQELQVTKDNLGNETSAQVHVHFFFKFPLWRLNVNNKKGIDINFFTNIQSAETAILHEMTHYAFPATDDGQSGKDWMNAEILDDTMNEKSVRGSLLSTWQKLRNDFGSKCCGDYNIGNRK
jgi:RHS repeat-associated protein